MSPTKSALSQTIQVIDDRAEKKKFQEERIQSLNSEEYLAFHQCRLTNFLQRGKSTLLDWLKIDKSQAETKNVELFAYLMRVLLTMIVE